LSKTPNLWPTNTRTAYSLLISALNSSPLLQKLQCWIVVPFRPTWAKPRIRMYVGRRHCCRLSVTGFLPIWFQDSPCGFIADKVALRWAFPSTSLFPPQPHSTDAPYLRTCSVIYRRSQYITAVLKLDSIGVQNTNIIALLRSVAQYVHGNTLTPVVTWKWLGSSRRICSFNRFPTLVSRCYS
jgi:hypothetical protein